MFIQRLAGSDAPAPESLEVEIEAIFLAGPLHHDTGNSAVATVSGSSCSLNDCTTAANERGTLPSKMVLPPATTGSGGSRPTGAWDRRSARLPVAGVSMVIVCPSTCAAKISLGFTALAA